MNDKWRGWIKALFWQDLLKKTIIITTFFGVATYLVNLDIAQVGGKGWAVSIAEAKTAQVALVLGARVYQSGALSTVLADRVETGIELYKAGKVEKLLLSGDHGRDSYDEVNNMRLYAEARGVPPEDIFMDHAGFSTYDSMYRARDVFMIDKAIIVTQDFHLARAVYIARELGIEAQGLKADKRSYPGLAYNQSREILARVKAFGQLLLRSKPRYLGPAIPITGDGRVTRDRV